MPLLVQPVTLEDFATFKSYSTSPDGVVVTPALEEFWPVSSPSAATARNEWGTAQQREIFLADKTAVFLKAVDSETKEILSLARWHFYPAGFKYPQDARLEFDAFSHNDGTLEGTEWPEGLNAKIYVTLLGAIFRDREEWQGNGPCWTLTTLITRDGHRRKGAGKLLVEWGVQKAREKGVPAFIESSPDGVPLYSKCGFEIVGSKALDKKALETDMDVTITRMALYPSAPAT